MKTLHFSQLSARFAYTGQFQLEKILPGLNGETFGSNLPVWDLSGVGVLLLPSTITGTPSISGVLTPIGGIAAAGGQTMPTVFHSGGYDALTTTGANQKQIVTTETYYVEVFIPANTTITGISVLNGHTTAAQHIFVGLANATGVIVANSNTTTLQGTADTFQQIPFSAPYAAVGPAKYYIAVQSDQTTGFIATHAALGNFGANKKTSETYGTFLTTASYATTTYTASLGPIADTY